MAAFQKFFIDRMSVQSVHKDLELRLNPIQYALKSVIFQNCCYVDVAGICAYYDQRYLFFVTELFV